MHILTGLLSSYRQSHVLRSSTSDLLSTQSSLTNIAARRFSCCAHAVWNILPSFVRTADSFSSFRSQLKTYMFARHFVAGPLSAPLIPLFGFSRVINSLLTYLLICAGKIELAYTWLINGTFYKTQFTTSRLMHWVVMLVIRSLRCRQVLTRFEKIHPVERQLLFR